jgi:hypothetical protein
MGNMNIYLLRVEWTIVGTNDTLEVSLAFSAHDDDEACFIVNTEIDAFLKKNRIKRSELNNYSIKKFEYNKSLLNGKDTLILITKRVSRHELITERY